MMRAATLVALLVVVAAGGFVVGRRPQTPPDPARTIVVERSGSREVVTREVGADAAQLRAIVREEIARAAAPSNGPAPTTADPASNAAYDKARAVVDAALAAGTWTEGDRDAVRPTLSSLTREQFEELNRALIPALNEGRLRRAFSGMPL